MRQIECNEIVGKTVVGYAFGRYAHSPELLLVVFDSREFIVFEAARDYEDVEIRDGGEYRFEDWGRDDLVDSGFMTAEEYDEIVREKEMVTNRQTEYQRKQSEQRDRELYEELKKRFEPEAS